MPRNHSHRDICERWDELRKGKVPWSDVVDTLCKLLMLSVSYFPQRQVPLLAYLTKFLER